MRSSEFQAGQITQLLFYYFSLDIAIALIYPVNRYSVSKINKMYDARSHMCFKIGRVMRRISAFYEERLAPFGLTPSQYLLFNVLWMEDGIGLGELGERVTLDAATLTGLIDRMEKSGYVERQPNPGDRRSVLVFLTPKAREVGPKILAFANELDCKLKKQFTPEEMAVFEKVLNSLASAAIENRNISV